MQMGKTVTSSCQHCMKRSGIFESLKADELSHVEMCRVSMHYNVGEMIFKQGSPCYDFVCVTSGLVKLYIEGGQGHRIIIGFAKPVDYIFVPGAYDDKRHHFSAVACEETSACLVEAEVLQELVKTNPIFANNFIRKISGQAIALFEQISSLTQKQVPGRMADTLIKLSTKVYESNPFNSNLSRQDLADLSGMTKESAIRILKVFKDEGVIRIDGNLIEITDLTRLEGISRNG
jgi:CRP/FNR family transcriptional regulator